MAVEGNLLFDTTLRYLLLYIKFMYCNHLHDNNVFNSYSINYIRILLNRYVKISTGHTVKKRKTRSRLTSDLTVDTLCGVLGLFGLFSSILPGPL